MSEKNNTRRGKTQFPNLRPELNLKIRQEEIYVDYLSKLNDEEKAWLDKFNNEYVNASLDRKRPKNNLHKSKKLIKECTDRNNARNRDIFSKSRAAGYLDSMSTVAVANKLRVNDVEAKLVNKLDNFNNTSYKTRDSRPKGKHKAK